MKICCLGDIHYYGKRKDLKRLVENIEDSCLDVNAVVIVGDVSADGELGHVEDVLVAVKEAVDPVPVLVVPGNHDIYLSEYEVFSDVNSLTKLSMFNELVERVGCVALMKRPYIIGDVGFVGSIGWYDYSFVPEWLNLPLEAYREKAYGLQYWADRDYVRLPMSDEEFTLYLLRKFEEDIKKIYDSVESVVAVLHHLPFRELVTYKSRADWDYFSTFMGSESFGYVIGKYGKIRLVLYGHSHDGVDTRVCKEVKGIKCCNCASPVPLVLSL